MIANFSTRVASLCASARKPLRKGALTKAAILEQALYIASLEGLEALSFGILAEQMRMSKTGVLGRFGSMQALQLEVIELYRYRFEEAVIYPALNLPAGLPRLKAMFSHWSGHICSKRRVGCFYFSFASEYDDQPGSIRDALIINVLAWRQTLTSCVQKANDLGHFHPTADVNQFVHEMYGLILVLHHDVRLINDAKSIERTTLAFNRLVNRCTPT